MKKIITILIILSFLSAREPIKESRKLRIRGGIMVGVGVTLVVCYGIGIPFIIGGAFVKNRAKKLKEKGL